jgi:choline dehydrogenase-like flavoprotein
MAELGTPTGEFDYVVAGGGTAGCVLAARLSENPAVTVCLIEAGPSDVDDDAILELPEWMHLLDSGYDWDYPVEPQERGNSFMRHARARVLGGCSSHNSCIAFHPPAEALDDWVRMGATGWGSAEVLPLVDRLTETVLLRDVVPEDPCGAALLEAAALAGLPTVAFNRGETVRNGAGWFQINAALEQDGRRTRMTRLSSSHAFLHPILATRKNLEVRTNSWISEILFDDALRATGVRYQRPDLTGYDTVSARREVIVTAGAIDTPKLLMLSGIGPTAHLREIGVDVRVDSPGVGANLDDHVEGLVFWEASKPMVTTSTQWWEIGLFTTIDPVPEGVQAQPDLMMHYGSVPFDMNTLRHGYPTTDNGFCLTPNVTQGHSRGTVRLRSRDFRDRAKVDPRYFTDPDGYDDRIMLAGVRLARAIAEQPPLAAWVGRELAPGPDAQTDDELLDYIHRCHNTVYHPAATARMGAASDPMAVLDPQLRVKGVDRLRVVDASAMPKLPSVNPNITVMTMAEKCADLIRAT